MPSLVGSEMCIRDRLHSVKLYALEKGLKRDAELGVLQSAGYGSFVAIDKRNNLDSYYHVKTKINISSLVWWPSISYDQSKTVGCAYPKDPSCNKDIVPGPLETAGLKKLAEKEGSLAILVMVHNRPSYTERMLTSLFGAMGEERMRKYPVIISQDGDDAAEMEMIGRFRDRAYSIQGFQRQLKLNAQGNYLSGDLYNRLARHFQFGLGTVLMEFGFDSIIVVEEDLEFSPDFFPYMEATLPTLKSDPSLLCTSAWNDHGVASLVGNETKLLRTSIFPGLGWMTTREKWKPIYEIWTDSVSYWDDWLRKRMLHEKLECIRPEISRSKTFGAEGTSEGQFYNSYLSRMKLQERVVDWSSHDLSYLESSAFYSLQEKVLLSLPDVSISELTKLDKEDSLSDRNFPLATLSCHKGSFRVRYVDAADIDLLSKSVGFLADKRINTYRCTFKGVFSFTFKEYCVYLFKDWPAV
eukprot:TRINITY_DN72485_c0_g1_i1.p1 TRINITY_DN72485_c0_g1~~TRINITY_DN72485_c0_g1_i1.p1  ORF type:complete len:468 (-),score=23.31 TRINITY_DN72485_c0_g1_i1:376-1779(-)